jgi:hypothetical protein
MIKNLKELLGRAENWPEAAQEELVQIGLEIEAEHVTGVYHATPEELRAIDEAERSGIASAEEVEVAFATFVNR